MIGQFAILAGSAPGGWGAEAGDFLCLSGRRSLDFTVNSVKYA